MTKQAFQTGNICENDFAAASYLPNLTLYEIETNDAAAGFGRPYCNGLYLHR